MATSKTLAPTNVTIQIPEFTDQPDQRVNSNCIDKEADAINALNTQIATHTFGTAIVVDATGFTTQTDGYLILNYKNTSTQNVTYYVNDNAVIQYVGTGGTTWFTTSLYVKKGMTIKGTNGVASQFGASFLPLT